MSELNNFTIMLIGFVAYPIIKFVTIAVWDKIATSCEETSRPSKDYMDIAEEICSKDNK